MSLPHARRGFTVWCWGAAAVMLLLSRQALSVLDGVLFGLAYLCMSLVTVAITLDLPAARVGSTGRKRLWLQLGIVVVSIVLTGWRGLSFHEVIGPEATLPLWSSLVGALQRAGDAWFGNSNFVANPVLYFGLPLLLLMLAGAHPRDIGFGPGHRVGRVLLLWGAIPLAVFASALISGVLTAGVLAARLLSDALNNGIS